MSNPDNTTLIPEIEVPRAVLQEFRTGFRMHAARALVRQTRVNQATAQLKNASRLMEGVGQLKYQIDSNLYWHMRQLHGPDCWHDPAFLKVAERDGLLKRVKGVSSKIMSLGALRKAEKLKSETLKQGKAKAASSMSQSHGPSFPTAHLPMIGGDA